MNGYTVLIVLILALTLIALVWRMDPKRLRAKLSGGNFKAEVDIEGGER